MSEDVNIEQATSALGTATPRQRARAVAAVAVGNLLEWYDFAVYAGLAAVLAQLFFPSHDPLLSLLASLSVFAVGFVLRPLGAIVFGHLADKHGRRSTLLVVITIMGAATVLIGVMPTYEQAGALGAILLLVARSAQGLSMGGEFSASTSFLVELAPPGRRGRYGSVAYLTACLGSFLGLGVVFVVRSALPADAINTWGWRIPFLVSFPLLVVGTYIRRKVVESATFVAAATRQPASRSPLAQVFRSHWRPMLVLFGITVVFAIAAYTVLAFALSYLISVVKYPTHDAYLSVLLSTFIGALAIPVFGSLSDRLGRKPVIVTGCAGLLVAAYPAYALLSKATFASVLGGQLLLWLFVAMLCGACPAAFCELFPTRLRTTGVGVSYSIALAVFGGTTPAVSTWLVKLTDTVSAPAWFIIGASALSLVAALTMRETARQELPG